MQENSIFISEQVIPFWPLWNIQDVHTEIPARWSWGMILAKGSRGPVFKSRTSTWYFISITPKSNCCLHSRRYRIDSSSVVYQKDFFFKITTNVYQITLHVPLNLKSLKKAAKNYWIFFWTPKNISSG